MLSRLVSWIDRSLVFPATFRNTQPTRRKACRDVLSLVFFVLFWAGMFVIGGWAIRTGIPEQLYYGIDKFGQVCGYESTSDVTITVEATSRGFSQPRNRSTYRLRAYDLRERTKLYFLNPFSMFDPATIKLRKAICVASCPGTDVRCDPTALPCDRDRSFICPYAKYADLGLNSGSALTTNLHLDPYDTAYLAELDALPSTAINCERDTDTVYPFPAAVPAGPLRVIQNNLSSCALRSYFPGYGPCYPVYASTVDVYSKCLPDLRPEANNTLLNALNDRRAILRSWASADRLDRYVADILKGIMMITLAGFAGGLVLSLFWVGLGRFFPALMGWGVLLATNIASGGW